MAEDEFIDIHTFLSNQRSFSFLSAHVLDELLDSFLVLHFQKRTVFPPEVDNRDYLYIIRKGTIEFCNQTSSSVEELEEGDICTFMCLPQDVKIAPKGVISENSVLYLLHCDQSESLRQAFPEFDLVLRESLKNWWQKTDTACQNYLFVDTAPLIKDFQTCKDVKGLRELSKSLPKTQSQLLNNGITADQSGKIITSCIDTITMRLIEIAQQQLGPAPIDFAWLAIGSQARQEQTVHTDQDNALLLADDYNQRTHSNYFAELAHFVQEGLNDCGIRYCPGEVMATNPEWCQPFAVWRQYFFDWIQTPKRKALMLACNFHDARVAYGCKVLLDTLKEEVLSLAATNEIYLAHMAANAISLKVPLGFFHTIQVEHDNEHQNTLDIKMGGIMPIVDLARVYALSAALPDVNTKDRLRAAREAGVLNDTGEADLRNSLTFLNLLRIRHQSDCIANKQPLNNDINPDLLSPSERHHLKGAFSDIQAAQNSLARRYRTSFLP
jgi:signal-transduction protein with cAMP-binding, CBS, and nucleotidyltransferase domain